MARKASTKGRAGKALSLEAFVLKTGYADLPPEVAAQAKRCLLDLIGVAAAGSLTPVSRIARDHAAEEMVAPKGSVRLVFDGRKASAAAAAFAGATTIDSFDAHDGHVLTKGHIGVSVLPTLLAMAEQGRVKDGRAFLASLVLGYEIGTRAGIALHATACDYHTSGAWGAIACAALASRHMGLDWARAREALGTAEYHGPRSQMMRCIAWPTMVKDGSGWGAFSGVSAAILAARGYTGAPAVTLEGKDVRRYWGDLGRRWRIMEQYFKAYPVCRWAQPAVEAAAALQRAHGFRAADIKRLEVRSFYNAIALNARVPDSTDTAQYSTPFPVAAYLVRGKLGAAEVTGRALKDPKILRLTRGMVLTEWPEFTRRFPAERWAQVLVTLKDGRKLASAPAIARGNPENPLSGDEIAAKYRALTVPILGAKRSAAIARAVDGLDRPGAKLKPLLDLVLKPA